MSHPVFKGLSHKLSRTAFLFTLDTVPFSNADRLLTDCECMIFSQHQTAQTSIWRWTSLPISQVHSYTTLQGHLWLLGLLTAIKPRCRAHADTFTRGGPSTSENRTMSAVLLWRTTAMNNKVITHELYHQRTDWQCMFTESTVKLKFHWDQFPRNFPVANVTGKSPTSYEEAGDYQTISTCPYGLACR